MILLDAPWIEDMKIVKFLQPWTILRFFVFCTKRFHSGLVCSVRICRINVFSLVRSWSLTFSVLFTENFFKACSIFFQYRYSSETPFSNPLRYEENQEDFERDSQCTYLIYSYVMVEDTTDMVLSSLISMISVSSLQSLNAGYIAVQVSRRNYVTQWLQIIMKNNNMVNIYPKGTKIK